jgi:hypothetical protein
MSLTVRLFAPNLERRLRGPEHPDTATNLNNLALLYQDMDDYTKAEPLYQEALRIRQKVLSIAFSTRFSGEIFRASCSKQIVKNIEAYVQI